jgi:hypothetical protein
VLPGYFIPLQRGPGTEQVPGIAGNDEIPVQEITPPLTAEPINNTSKIF